MIITAASAKSLGVLAVLDLAIGVASLYSRRGGLQLGALAASQVILIFWELAAEQAPWPKVAIVCALLWRLSDWRGFNWGASGWQPLEAGLAFSSPRLPRWSSWFTET